MDLEGALSFACATLAAAGNATANVMQRKASLEQPEGRRFDVSLMADLVRRSTWLLGFGGMVASFVLQAIALSLGQLSAVEPIITLEVPLTLLVASRVFGRRIGNAEWVGIWAMTIGMIALIAALDPQPGDEVDVSNAMYAVAGGATALFIVVLLLASTRGNRIWRTACLGAAVGTSFGLTATLVKATTARLSTDGIVGMLTAWETYAAAGIGIFGVITMQAALHTGPLLASQPGFTLMDPLVSILWGVLVFDETTRTGLWLLPPCLGAIAVGYGAMLVARSPLLAELTETVPATAAPEAAS